MTSGSNKRTTESKDTSSPSSSSSNSKARRGVGEYDVTKLIGRGSFADVYRGHHHRTRLPVAIKSIDRAKLKSNAKYQDNLETEIALLRQLQHPNIVRLYDTATTERHIYLVMELCQGGDLTQYLKRLGSPGLAESLVQRFARQLKEGLRYLHERNLVHRDIKPANLLLDISDGERAVLKIADFGFARFMDPMQVDMAATLCGSPLYMAPEILRHEKYDARVDLWSVGAVLYELVTGQPPFTAANPMELLRRIDAKCDQLSLAGLETPPSSACQHLILSLLKRLPAERLSFADFFAHPFFSVETATTTATTYSPPPPTLGGDHKVVVTAKSSRVLARSSSSPAAAAATTSIVLQQRASPKPLISSPHTPPSQLLSDRNTPKSTNRSSQTRLTSSRSQLITTAADKKQVVAAAAIDAPDADFVLVPVAAEIQRASGSIVVENTTGTSTVASMTVGTRTAAAATTTRTRTNNLSLSRSLDETTMTGLQEEAQRADACAECGRRLEKMEQRLAGLAVYTKALKLYAAFLGRGESKMAVAKLHQGIGQHFASVWQRVEALKQAVDQAVLLSPSSSACLSAQDMTTACAEYHLHQAALEMVNEGAIEEMAGRKARARLKYAVAHRVWQLLLLEAVEACDVVDQDSLRQLIELVASRLSVVRLS